MSDKLCTRCKLNTVEDPYEELCQDCIDKTLYYRDLYYDIKYLAQIMGVSERTARRRAHDDKIPGKIPDDTRHLFKKDVIDEWDKAGQLIQISPKTPTNPLQEKALARCRKKDHSWLSDPKYDGIAYTSEQTTVKQTKYTVLVGYNRTCYFCKYSTFILA